jgi:hypothetical protein
MGVFMCVTELLFLIRSFDTRCFIQYVFSLRVRTLLFCDVLSGRTDAEGEAC